MKGHIFILLFTLCFLPVLTHAQASILGTVDIIVEADTITPYFYTGRPEPTRGSKVRVVAFLENTTIDGEYSYRWEINNKPLYGGFVEDKKVAEFTAPDSSSVLISVQVRNKDGVLIAQNQQHVSLSEPKMLFYEQNLLRGTTHTSIKETHTLLSDEIIIYAVPYFMSKDIFSKKHRAVWNIGGKKVAHSPDTPNIITFKNTSEETGSTDIQFKLWNERMLTQFSEYSFLLNY